MLRLLRIIKQKIALIEATDVFNPYLLFIYFFWHAFF